MSTQLPQSFIDRMLSQTNAERIRVRLYTAPAGTLPSGNMDGFTEVSGTGYARSGGDVTWTASIIRIAQPIYVYDPSVDRDDDPYELDMTDATPTGVGDPLAGVLRSIDELLEGQ